MVHNLEKFSLKLLQIEEEERNSLKLIIQLERIRLPDAKMIGALGTIRICKSSFLDRKLFSLKDCIMCGSLKIDRRKLTARKLSADNWPRRKIDGGGNLTAVASSKSAATNFILYFMNTSSVHMDCAYANLFRLIDAVSYTHLTLPTIYSV